MKQGRDHVFFTVDKTTEDEINKGDLKLYIDTTYDPMRHARIFGKVIAIPRKLTKTIIGSKPEPFPPSATKPMEFRYLDEIVPEVKIGDKIYFHYLTLSEPEKTLVATWNNRDVYAVRYDQIYCAVRNGEIIPIGGHVLVEPEFESWDDILLPTYETFPDGSKQELPRDKWIQTRVEPRAKDLRGIVRHVGTPPTGEEHNLKEGDHILFRRNADFMIKVEGEEYYVMKSRNIHGTFVDAQEES